MKEYTAESIRNISFAGHSGSGKSSIAESILYIAGETTRVGSIAEGNTISDYSQNEIERKFSISVSLMHCEWQGVKVNMLDTPGYSDFVGEVYSGASVADTNIFVVKAVEGVEVGTEAAFKVVSEKGGSTAVIINKLDAERSDYKNVISDVRERLTPGAVIVTFPVNEGLSVDTIVDVVSMKAYRFGELNSKKVEEVDVPAGVKADAETLRTEFIEKVAESDEELMNAYFEHGTLTDEEIHSGITKSMASGALSPVFCMSAIKGVGVQPFLDFVKVHFPSPLDMPAAVALRKDGKTKAEVKPDTYKEASLFIFKVISEPHVGELSLFKVMSGHVKAGLDLVNTVNGKPERLSQLSLLNGHNRKDITMVHAGDLAAVVKLKDTHTNNTLCDKNNEIVFSPIKFPEAIIHGAILPKAKGDEDKIASCLHTLHEEDPSFNVKYDPEIAQTVISGQGELQLALAVKRLKERYGVDVDLAQPRIPYRETIKGMCESVEYKHKKQSGGRGQFGHIFLKLEPLPRGTGFQFVDAIVGGVVPGRFVPAVEKGIIETMEKGILSGCRVIDVKATLFFGSYHNVDSDEMSFKLAASQGFKKGFMEAKPMLLEPVYEVTITVPEDYMGDVMGDISTKRGKIQGMESNGRFQIIKALVPLAELYKYSSTLRSLTGGRGTYARQFSHYDEVPKEVETKIIEDYKASRAEE